MVKSYHSKALPTTAPATRIMEFAGLCTGVLIGVLNRVLIGTLL
jgi:hypothetical protein